MPGREQILQLIPHQGDMCLLDAVVSWDAVRLVAMTRSHRLASNPLRLNGRLRALHLCEYGAQAMAVHGGLRARSEGRRAAPGLLVSLREVTFQVDYLDDLAGELRIHVERLQGDDVGWQYAFGVSHEGAPLASGRAAVIATPPG